MLQPKDRIIVALDVDKLSYAETLASGLSPYVGWCKVGLELTGAEGDPAVIKAIRKRGENKVFLDKKFYDIPNTMAGAARAAVSQGVDMFNVHASAGREGILACSRVKESALLIAVTVLTSFDDEECVRVYGSDVKDTIARLAELVHDCGIDGVVCAPTDVEAIKAKYPKLLAITPGVRPLWAAAGDQKRVTTPAQAIKRGSDYMVIGRPILQPPEEIGSPADAARRIVDEIFSAT